MTDPEPRRPKDPEPGDAEPGEAEASDEARRERARRRRRVDEVFGDVMPSVTDDERDPGHRGGFAPEHYRSNQPPHHGG